MYTFNSLGEYVAKLYNKIKNDYMSQPDKQGKQFTAEDGKAVNKLLVAAFAKEVMEEQPGINPDRIVELYGDSVKSIKRLTEENCLDATGLTWEQRNDRHKRAARSFAEGMANNCGFVEGREKAVDLQLNRQELQILRYLNEADRNSYLEAIKNKDQHKRFKYNFKAIGNMLNACKNDFDVNLPDEELINKFPNIAGHCMLINEAGTLLDAIAADKPAEISDRELKEYKNTVSNLMALAAGYQNRMSVMADPFYPHVNLEVMFETDPEVLAQLNADVVANLDEIAQDPENGFSLYNNKEDFEAARDNAGFVAEGNYLNKICVDENVFKLPSVIANSVYSLAERKVTSRLGGEMNDIYKNVLFFDKDGNHIDMSQSNLTDKLREIGEFYIVDRDGKIRPVPARLENNGDKFNFLIGDTDFATYEKTLKEPTMSFGSKLWNGVVRTVSFGATRSDARKEYKAEKARIEHLRNLGHGDYPEQIKKHFDHIRKVNAELDKNKKSRAFSADGLLKGIKHIPVENTKAFDDALINLMVNMGLNAPRSDFHTTMQELLGVFAPGFAEANAINTFRNRAQVREFVWKLRTEEKNKELLAKLQSGDKKKAKEAMAEIADRFVGEFNVNNPWNKPVSEDYRKFVKAQDERIKADKKAEKDSFVNDDNYYWKTVNSFFGSKLDPRIDWMPETLGNGIYSMNDFVKLKNHEIKLNECVAKGLDEETFASLGMILSLGKTVGNRKLKKPLDRDTMTFEDIILTGKPHKNIGEIIDPVIKPTRENLIKDLNSFDLEGGDNLARDLAGALKVYAAHVGKYDWTDRKYAEVTAVADRVMKFIKDNKLMYAVKKCGLTEAEIARIKTANAIGQTLKDAAQATELLRKAEIGHELSAQKCKECIDKIMRYKAVMADMKANENIAQINRNSNGKKMGRLFNDDVNYPFMAINLVGDKFQAASFGLRMMPESERLKLAKKGPKAVLKALNDKSLEEKMLVARMNPRKERDKEAQAFDSRREFVNKLKNSMANNRNGLKGVAALYNAYVKNDNVEGCIALSKMSDNDLLKTNREYLAALNQNAKNKNRNQKKAVGEKKEQAKNNNKVNKPKITEETLQRFYGDNYKSAKKQPVADKKNEIIQPKKVEGVDNKLAKSENNVNVPAVKNEVNLNLNVKEAKKEQLKLEKDIEVRKRSKSVAMIG